MTGKLHVKNSNSDTINVYDKKDVKVIKDAVIKLDKEEIKALKGLEDK